MTTVESYKKNLGLTPVAPEPCGYVVAVDAAGLARTWIMPIKFRWMPACKWAVVSAQDKSSWMFKDTGTFGYTENRYDIEKHAYDTMEEAYAAFTKFYGTP